MQLIIDEMIVALQAAKTVPLSQNVLADREAIISNLQRIADGIPEEVKQARWMVREREAFVARTNEKAREITERAQQSAPVSWSARATFWLRRWKRRTS